jgi:phosphopantothenoylcysteine decarboxylase / phosphopantothenate---cysteine ligase
MSKKVYKKNVLIGVCGGIAAYKTCELARLLVKEGYAVKIMMTRAAAAFVSPLTFQTLSKNAVYLDMFSFSKNDSIEHISLSQWADICLIAPCSANTLSKIARGICDNLLTTVVCALDEKTPVLIASAMNTHMWHNPLIQENLRRLKRYKKYTIMAPEEGELACGTYGLGRMPEAKSIYKKTLALI